MEGQPQQQPQQSQNTQQSMPKKTSIGRVVAILVALAVVGAGFYFLTGLSAGISSLAYRETLLGDVEFQVHVVNNGFLTQTVDVNCEVVTSSGTYTNLGIVTLKPGDFEVLTIVVNIPYGEFDSIQDLRCY